MASTAGDLSALEALFRRELDAIYRYIATRVGPTEADDVVGEVFHAAALAYADGRHTDVTRPWLFAVARNRVIERWRRASRRKALNHLAIPSQQPHFPADWTEDPRRGAVLDALAQLPERHRTLLILHHVDGMPVRELAASTDQSERAVESALARARRGFRRHYREEDPWTN